MSSDGKTTPVADANRMVGRATEGINRRIHVDRSASRMALLLVGTFVLFATLRPHVFLSSINLQNIGIAAPEIGLLALAVMVTMLTGGIDLSVVAIANGTAITVSTAYTALVDSSGQGTANALTPLLIVLGVLVGVLLGSVNGLLISRVGITPILATLGTMQVFNGLEVVWTGGVTISGAPPMLTKMASTLILGVPVLMMILIVVAVLLAVFINRTPGGRKVQLEGANPVATTYSGISGRATLMLTYVVSGLLASIAGLVFIGRNPTASADYGSSYVLLVIVVVVLGGTNPAGGFATVLGVVLATLTLQVLSSGFTALRLTAYEYAVAQGIILVGVMVLDQTVFARSTRRPMSSVEDTEPLSAATSEMEPTS